jgi:hypothetical protein
MADSSDLWYRLGYALESARHGKPARSLRGLSARRPPESARRAKDAPRKAAEPGGGHGGGQGAGEPSALDLALAAGAGTALARLLEVWPGRGGPGVIGLARAALAGAGAVLLRQTLAPLLEGELRAPTWSEGDMGERLAAGAARGLVYGGLVEPRLPGTPLLRGLGFGAAEWALSEWGGLRGIFAGHTPYRRLPVVGSALGDAQAGEDTLVDHLAYGAALALLYDAGLRMGIGDDAE